MEGTRKILANLSPCMYSLTLTYCEILIFPPHSGGLHPHVAKHLSVVHFDSGGYASWRHKMQRAAESNGYTYEECERKVCW